MSVDKHLEKARKFASQNHIADAIYEYRLILDLDPGNPAALDALKELTDAPIEDDLPVAPGSRPKIRTNFLQHQAESSSAPLAKQAPLMVLFLVIGAAALYGIYQGVMYFLNYDKMIAMKYVEVHLQKPVQRDGAAYVTVEIDNLNPRDIKSPTFKYHVTGADGTVIASGVSSINHTIPAGEKRSFGEVKLGELNGAASHMGADLVDVTLGPKPDMPNEYANKFIEASALTPAEAVPAFTEIAKAQPSFAPTYVRLGQAFLSNGDNNKAIRAFEKAIRLSPQDANAHYHLGVAHFYAKNKQAATKEFKQAVEIDPDEPLFAQALKQVNGGITPVGSKSASSDSEQTDAEQAPADEQKN